MLYRTLSVILFVLLTCVACFGQSSYKGLTPGQSTRADVERVLGPPVKEISDLLVEYAPRPAETTTTSGKIYEYKPQQNADRLYVQYRDKSTAAIAERIELTCDSKGELYKCVGLRNFAELQYRVEPTMVDIKQQLAGGKYTLYYGQPQFIVETSIDTYPDDVWGNIRYAFYSKELYESAVPKGGCTGTIFGEWDTNRGRLTVARAGNSTNVKGSYSTNKGTFTGKLTDMHYNFRGEWSDATGSGTMELNSADSPENTFTGTWKRSTGKGPSEGKWEGRCVETKTGGND